MTIPENVQSNGSQHYANSDWRDGLVDSDDTSTTLAGESLTVQAAYKYLSDAHYQLWGIWAVYDPARRILAARWLAEQIQEVEKVLRSNDFQPS